VQNLLSSCFLSKSIKIKIFRTIILPIVLYGFETWLLTLDEKYRLRAFENRVLRRIFGPKWVEVKGEWRKDIMRSLLLTTYYLGGQIEKNELSGACSMYGETIIVYRILVGKSEGKRPLGRPRCRW
jgi:hypothetical protein